MQHLPSLGTPLSYICCMVYVIVPEGGGQYSQLAPFSLAVVWPARCAAIKPAGNVREKESERVTGIERETGN